MKPKDYMDGLVRLQMAARLLYGVDMSAMLGHINRVETLGPILTPVEFRDGIKNLRDAEKLVRGSQRFVAAAEEVGLFRALEEGHKATAAEVPAVLSGDVYVIQHRPHPGDHALWWRPESSGYTVYLGGAGHYTEEEASKIAGWRDRAGPEYGEEVAYRLQDVVGLGSTVVATDRLVGVPARPPSGQPKGGTGR